METLNHLAGSRGVNSSILGHLPGFAHSFNISQPKALLYEHYGLFEQLLPIKNGVYSFFSPSHGQIDIIVFILCLAWALGPLVKTPPAVTNAVYHGYRSWLEPTALLKARFMFNSQALISSGSLKWKDRPFVLRRWDLDFTVLPNKYMEELRFYPATKLSGIVAHISNLVPKWTYSEVIMKSNIHFRALLQKVTPELPKYLDISRKELEYSWDFDMPHPEDWTKVDIQESVRMCVARMTAKLFLGEPACRDRKWLRITIEFSFELFALGFILRKVPKFLLPIVAPITPLRWKVASTLKTSEKIVGPLMERHRECLRRRKAGESVDEEDTLLNWMMDHGTEEENRLDQMAHRLTITTLAAIHTTSMATSNLLFDLCAHPEWFSVLREEIAEIEQELGKLGERPGIGAAQWLPRLEKMDSALIESLRLSPPLLLANQRQALVPITLKDGTHIPAGTRIACAKADLVYNDPTVSTFDPMRSYRKRYETGELDKHQAGMPEKEYLHFGYGRQACPGRWFAIGEVKMMMVRLLTEYDFKFIEGKGRPSTFHLDEMAFLNPLAKLMMRKRRVPCDKCGRC